MSGLPGMRGAPRAAGDINEIERLNAQVVMLREELTLSRIIMGGDAMIQNAGFYASSIDAIDIALSATESDWLAAHDAKIRQSDRDRANTAERAILDRTRNNRNMR